MRRPSRMTKIVSEEPKSAPLSDEQWATIVARGYHAGIMIALQQIPYPVSEAYRSVGLTDTNGALLHRFVLPVRVMRRVADERFVVPMDDPKDVHAALTSFLADNSLTPWGVDQIEEALNPTDSTPPKVPVLQLLHGKYGLSDLRVIGADYQFHLSKESPGSLITQDAPRPLKSKRSLDSPSDPVPRDGTLWIDVSSGTCLTREKVLDNTDQFQRLRNDWLPNSTSQQSCAVIMRGIQAGDELDGFLASDEGSSGRIGISGYLYATTLRPQTVEEFRFGLTIAEGDQVRYLVRRMTARVREEERKERKRMLDHQEQYLKSASAVGRLSQMLTALERGGADVVRTSIAGIADLPGVVSCAFAGNGLLIETERFAYPGGVNAGGITTPPRFLGQYRVAIDLVSGTIDVQNTMMASKEQPAVTTKTGSSQHYGACLGSYGTVFAGALASADYVALAISVVEFLRDPHVDDASARNLLLTNFPEHPPLRPVASEWLSLVSLSTGYAPEGSSAFMEDDD